MQLAIAMDVGKLFVSKTYLLERDCELIVEVYKHLQELSTACALESYPEAVEAACSLAGDNPAVMQQLLAEAKQCFVPAVLYFQRRFNHCEGNLFASVKMFKALRIVWPVQAPQLQVGLRDVQAIRILACLDDDDTIGQLQEELPIYLISLLQLIARCLTTQHS